MPVRDVTTAHVIRVLEPIWLTKTETATRVRSRIELVLDFAAAKGLREGPTRPDGEETWTPRFLVLPRLPRFSITRPLT